jgi:serine/threonine-protein kinase PknK
MIFRRSSTAEPRPPGGYSGLQRIPGGGAVMAFHAVQERLGRPVLLFIAPQVRDFDRFRWVLAALPAHPGVAAVYDAGRTTDGHPYVTTAAVGGSLWNRIGAGGPLAPAAATALVLRLADTVAAVHGAGVVHGDIRPEYIWGADESAPVLTGFGLCAPGPAEPVTLVHLAPEVLEGAEPSIASDVYALASVLQTLLAGEPVHLAAAWAGLAALIQRKLDPTPPVIARADVPHELLAVIQRGMAPDPAARYGSAAEFATALRSLDAEPSPAPEAEPAPSAVREYAPPATPPPDREAGVHGLDVETTAGGPGRPGGRRVLVVAAAALAIVALIGVVGALNKGRSIPGTPRATPRAAAAARPRPTATRQAPTLSKLELTRYQPTRLKVVPAPQQAVLTWQLPADAKRDGAGILIRRQPADDAPVAALSRTDGRLPETYVAVPLKPGQQYCFLVGVLLQRSGGETTLAQSGPVCAMPR